MSNFWKAFKENWAAYSLILIVSTGILTSILHVQLIALIISLLALRYALKKSQFINFVHRYSHWRYELKDRRAYLVTAGLIFVLAWASFKNFLIALIVTALAIVLLKQSNKLKRFDEKEDASDNQ